MSKFLRSALFLFLILFFASLRTNTNGFPDWFISAFKANGLDKKYELSSFLKPAYLQSDFNGDSHQDIAALVIEKKNKKKGILLIEGKILNYFIFGAGTNFGDGSDDFKWATDWSLYNKKYADETTFDKKSGDILGSKKINLSRPGILIEDTENSFAGVIIYWNGKKYIGIHQGE